MLPTLTAMAKENWVKVLQALLDDIQTWAKEKHWAVDSQKKQITENSMGAYATRELTIRAPGGTLLVEPIAHDVPNADGRVDISSFPSLHRMLLIRKRGKWHLYTDSGVPWPKKWNRETFIDVAKTLTAE